MLAEGEQIRREADNIGPRAELDYWKKRMTKFNNLLDQMKSAHVKGVLTVLQTAKSKYIQVKSSHLCLCLSLINYPFSNGRSSM